MHLGFRALPQRKISNELLAYVIFVRLLIFYILTILGIFRLRRTKPDWPRPYKAFGYPVLPLLYVLLAGAICILLFLFKPTFTWPGLGIVLLGIPIYYGITKVNKSPHADVNDLDRLSWGSTASGLWLMTIPCYS